MAQGRIAERILTATVAEDVRLIVDEPAGGAWNMAVDEVLLEDAVLRDDAVNTGAVCMRFYRWCEPTLSLGYFQPYDERHSHSASAHCPVVRRASGGGAILHDRELTYSLVLPAGHRLGRHPDELYGRVHQTLVRALSGLGIETRPYGVGNTSLAGAGAATQSPFLCYQRRSPVDLVQEWRKQGDLKQGDLKQRDRKIVGSAQRRRRGAVLQHGSVLLATSPAAPEVPGPVCEDAPPVADDLIGRWWVELARELDWTVEPAKLSDRQHRRAEELARGKYGRESWTRRR